MMSCPLVAVKTICGFAIDGAPGAGVRKFGSGGPPRSGRACAAETCLDGETASPVHAQAATHAATTMARATILFKPVMTTPA
jgi:hypothetical protein